MYYAVLFQGLFFFTDIFILLLRALWYTSLRMVVPRALQHTFVSLVLHTLFFPIWWYTGGAARIMRYSAQEIEGIFRSLNIPTLFRFLLSPMFGFRDPVSRIIGVGVRTVHFFVLFVYACVASCFWIVVLLLWLILPIIATYQMWFHLFS